VRARRIPASVPTPTFFPRRPEATNLVRRYGIEVIRIVDDGMTTDGTRRSQLYDFGTCSFCLHGGSGDEPLEGGSGKQASSGENDVWSGVNGKRRQSSEL
jgi:hypothetical protein